MKRTAFTMIELIFVVVVLGILAAVALPKMSGVVTSSYSASAKGDVSGIRAAIAAARQKQLVKGKNDYITKLSTGANNTKGATLFDGNGSLTLLTYPIIAKSVGWMKTGSKTYTFSDGTDTTTFIYYDTKTKIGTTVHAAGTFDCDHSDTFCKKIVE